MRPRTGTRMGTSNDLASPVPRSSIGECIKEAGVCSGLWLANVGARQQCELGGDSKGSRTVKPGGRVRELREDAGGILNVRDPPYRHGLVSDGHLQLGPLHYVSSPWSWLQGGFCVP